MTTPPKKSKPLVLRDEIHGDMIFDELLNHVIDHPCFQRLRHIKQLGLADFVFPCASHTRFQHSLGAAYLAGQYFDSMISSWLTVPFQFNDSSEKTKFFSKKTLDCVREVSEHTPSREFWWQVVSLSGLLHDVGHGPWSHTFEFLELRQDFDADLGSMTGSVGEYFKNKKRSQPRIKHEDISVIYIFKILNDLATWGILDDPQRYFLPVAALVNRKMMASDSSAKMELELTELLQRFQIKGGVEIHRLLRPIISGPFDVDRMDYIQRDGRNCGVFIGGIEWRRIVSKLIPCLADHESDGGEPREVVLISNVKNQHILDDFIFSLFQMYAQVYLHPKIVGLEEIIKQLIKKNGRSRDKVVIDFDRHCSLTDEKFRDLLKHELGLEEIEKLLLRQAGSTFEVVSLPVESGMEKELKQSRFAPIDSIEDRPMMKDSVGVFLFSSLKEATNRKNTFVTAWTKASPIAQHFHSIHYSPKIWYRRDEP